SDSIPVNSFSSFSCFESFNEIETPSLPAIGSSGVNDCEIVISALSPGSKTARSSLICIAALSSRAAVHGWLRISPIAPWQYLGASPYFWPQAPPLALASSSSTSLRVSSLIRSVFFSVRNLTERPSVVAASCARIGRTAKENAKNKAAKKRTAKCFIYPSLQWRTAQICSYCQFNDRY